MLARVGSLAAALVFVGVVAGGAAPSPARPAAVPNVVVFGGGEDVPGFNTALACCNLTSPSLEAAGEAIRGAFKLGDRGRWIHDLVATASADESGLSYTIKPNAYWYWGGRKIAVTYRDFVYTLQKIMDPNTDAAGRAGYSQLDVTRFKHRGERQVTFPWRKN